MRSKKIEKGNSEGRRCSGNDSFPIFKSFENNALSLVPWSAHPNIHLSIDHFLDIGYVLNIRLNLFYIKYTVLLSAFLCLFIFATIHSEYLVVIV